MNEANVRKWVERLEDPSSRQTRGALERLDGSACCLGHACRATIADVVSVQVQTEGNYTLFDRYATRLPPSVQNWLGTTEMTPQIGARSASELNDVLHLTLPQIAREIRTHWLGESL